MPDFDLQQIAGYLDTANNGATTTDKGRAFEDLICYLFPLIPGLAVMARNEMNVFQTEELDVAVWNDKLTDGLPFLPNIILVECKNWSNAVSSIEVNWFATKLEHSGQDFGIILANKGITGNAEDRTAAHSIIAANLIKGRRIIVLSRADIAELHTTEDLITLIKDKLCRLVVNGSI